MVKMPLKRGKCKLTIKFAGISHLLGKNSKTMSYIKIMSIDIADELLI